MMTEEQLRVIIKGEIKDSQGYLDGELSSARQELFDRYLGRPLGNEIEGKSRVVSSDILDTVEGILPHLMKLFASGDEICAFEPVGQEDEAAAKQATDLINHIFTKENNGFLVLYEAFKDALIQKNGFIKAWTEEAESWRKERYEGVGPETLTMFQSDESIEIVEIEDLGGGFNVTLRKSNKYRCFKVCAVPPEEFLISKEARGIQDARFVGHKKVMTASDLRDMGYPQDLIDQIGTDDDESLSDERFTRNTVEDDTKSGSTMNEAMREITVTEAYIRVDFDEDGVAERRKVVTAGTGATILENEEWEGPVPIASGSPVILPHRLVGLGVGDLAHEIQDVRTALTRQMLDALYQANNPIFEVLDDGVIDPDEVVNRKTGGVIRVKMPGTVREILQQNAGQYALQGLEYMDTVRENRTGFNRYAQGTDANAINKTASGVAQLQNAAMERILLMARALGETLVKDTFKILFALVCQYQDRPKVVRLRNNWVEMDPRNWNTQMDVSIQVGLGTGNREQQAAMIGQIIGMQVQALQFQGGANGPIVTLDNIYKAVTKFCEMAGFKNADMYFTDPTQAPPQPPSQPDAEMLKIQGDLQLGAQKLELDRQKTAGELAIKAEELKLKAAETQVDIQFKQADHELRRQDHEMNRDMSNVKLQLDARRLEHDKQAFRTSREDGIRDKRDAWNEYFQQENEAEVKEIAQMLQMIAEQNAQAQQAQAQTNQALAQAIQQLAGAMMAPRRAIYDKGKIVGSEVAAQ